LKKRNPIVHSTLSEPFIFVDLFTSLIPTIIYIKVEITPMAKMNEEYGTWFILNNAPIIEKENAIKNAFVYTLFGISINIAFVLFCSF
jgi:hypothetical protein